MEAAEITGSLGPSVPPDLIVVDVQDLLKAEEQRRQWVNQRGASGRGGTDDSPSPALSETTRAAWRHERG